jgi:hypothetical protein
MSSKFLHPGEYISPDEPGYDRQVLVVTRTITLTSTVPITSYPGVDVLGAIDHEHGLDLANVIELLLFIDESANGGDRVNLRTHVDVRRLTK